MDSNPHGLTVIDGGLSGPLADDKEVAGSKRWMAQTRKRAKELTKTLEVGYMELARILFQVHHTPTEGNPERAPVYTAWGYHSFKEYAEQELGIERKKAERLRQIWFVLEHQLVDMDPEIKERVVSLGYSKVRELVEVLTTRNARQWLELAEGGTYKQLYAAVRQEKYQQKMAEAVLGPSVVEGEDSGVSAKDDPDMGPSTPMAAVETVKQERFDLFPLQHENVLLAVRRAGELTGSDKKGHNLDMICTDFLATNDMVGSDVDKRFRYLAKIERNLGLKLVAVDPSTKDIVYGIKSLQALAADLKEE